MSRNNIPVKLTSEQMFELQTALIKQAHTAKVMFLLMGQTIERLRYFEPDSSLLSDWCDMLVEQDL